jgi:hypothetical protein
MDCPKCDGETESELQHSYFKADEVNDVSRKFSQNRDTRGP